MDRTGVLVAMEWECAFALVGVSYSFVRLFEVVIHW